MPVNPYEAQAHIANLREYRKKDLRKIQAKRAAIQERLTELNQAKEQLGRELDPILRACPIARERLGDDAQHSRALNLLLNFQDGLPLHPELQNLFEQGINDADKQKVVGWAQQHGGKAADFGNLHAQRVLTQELKARLQQTETTAALDPQTMDAPQLESAKQGLAEAKKLLDGTDSSKASYTGLKLPKIAILNHDGNIDEINNLLASVELTKDQLKLSPSDEALKQKLNGQEEDLKKAFKVLHDRLNNMRHMLGYTALHESEFTKFVDHYRQLDKKIAYTDVKDKAFSPYDHFYKDHHRLNSTLQNLVDNPPHISHPKKSYGKMKLADTTHGKGEHDSSSRDAGVDHDPEAHELALAEFLRDNPNALASSTDSTSRNLSALGDFAKNPFTFANRLRAGIYQDPVVRDRHGAIRTINFKAVKTQTGWSHDIRDSYIKNYYKPKLEALQKQREASSIQVETGDAPTTNTASASF